MNNRYASFLKHIDKYDNTKNITHYNVNDTTEEFVKKIEHNYNGKYTKYVKQPCCSKIYNKNIQIDTSIKIDIPVEKQKIDINMPAENITDILNIINKYEDNPLIEYNINVKTLHNIKQPLQQLHDMIGMKSLKTNIAAQIVYFIQNLHFNSDGDFMHTVISGPPGTGKTEIAKLIGDIFSKIGILKKGTFKKVTRRDLIAGYLGQTSLKTSDVIKEALGGVLFIDEAYSLGNAEKRDSFSKECIDTLCEALSDHKDNLMVIIAGYTEELNDCFFKYNRGLESRFVWRFKTDNYNAEDLLLIFLKKVADMRWEIHEKCHINGDWFKKHMHHFKHFGRDIETLLAKIKIVHSNRVFCKPIEDKKRITTEDINNGLNKFIENLSPSDQDSNRMYLQNTLYV
jgi:SpoVK/Ycf46/Vps4 family AAA+-type ATPase